MKKGLEGKEMFLQRKRVPEGNSKLSASQGVANSQDRGVLHPPLQMEWEIVLTILSESYIQEIGGIFSKLVSYDTGLLQSYYFNFAKV